MSNDAATSALDAAFATQPANSHDLLVGLSGGLDSSVLLHRLATGRRFVVRAIHVHHGLHSEADRWAQHCQAFCAALGVPLEIARVTVAHDRGEGLEAAARHARYGAFAVAMRDDEWLVTAHHRDDQAETVLMRLLRGSGAGGLAAMRPLRPFAPGHHWRPLLGTPRNILIDYAHRHGLAWIDDPSNVDEHHDRNFLRQKIMPALRERWPQAEAALARSAGLLSEHEYLLGEETARRSARIQGVDPNTLSVSALLKLSVQWRALVLRHWVSALDLPALPATGVEKIERDLLTARPDAKAEFRWHGAVIHRWRDLLYAETQSPDLVSDWRVDWDSATPLPLAIGGRLTLVRTETTDMTSSEMFRVSARRGGERITLPGRTHSHAVKIALQDFGVPPWQRKRLPLVFAADGELLAVGDVLLSMRAQTAGWSFRIDDAPDER